MELGSNSKALMVLGISMVIATAVFGGVYKQGIDERNAIEREKIESSERIKQAELEQRQQEALQAQNALDEAAQAKVIERHRTECKAIQNESMANYEEFINSCSQSNTMEWCMATDVGKLYIRDSGAVAIQRCIDGRLKLGL